MTNPSRRPKPAAKRPQRAPIPHPSPDSNNNQSNVARLGLLGTPEVDLVLDALGAGAVLEFREGEEHGEGLAVGVG